MARLFDPNNRAYFERKKAAAKLELQSFLPHYRDCAEFVQPRRGRFLLSDVNKGGSRYEKIINSRATWAHRVCVAGLLNGVMSASRPWFALEDEDPDMMEYQPIKEWLYKTETLMRGIFNSSNLYDAAPVMLSELILFATANMAHTKDFDTVARFYTHTAGSYMLGQDSKGRINTMIREYQMTTEQLIEEFGLENVSGTVKNAYDRGDYCVWFPVTEVIEPNPNYDQTKKLSQYKRFRSVKYETSAFGNTNSSSGDKFLSKKGYDRFPNYCLRWALTGEDVYGTDCPTMTALGDISQLQIEEQRKAQAIDKLVNPPLHGPASLRSSQVSVLPGGLTVYDSFQGGTQLGPIYQVDPRISELRQDMDAVERRIDNAYFVDLWLAISNMEGIQPRNQLDLSQRNGERLLQLGPVLERLHGDFLSPLIENTFSDMAEAGILPPPPPELQGRPLRTKFISSIAMAQREMATGGMDRLVAFTGGLVSMGLSDGKKLDGDQLIDEYAMAVGVPPRVVVPDEIVAAQREKEAEAQEQANAAQVATTAADVGQKLAKAEADGNR